MVKIVHFKGGKGSEKRLSDQWTKIHRMVTAESPSKRRMTRNWEITITRIGDYKTKLKSFISVVGSMGVLNSLVYLLSVWKSFTPDKIYVYD